MHFKLGKVMIFRRSEFVRNIFIVLINEILTSNKNVNLINLMNNMDFFIIIEGFSVVN